MGNFRFTKPVRLIELFAGYGSQAMAFERLRDAGALPFGFESYRIVEWGIPSMIAYAAIHHPTDKTDYSAAYSKAQLVSILAQYGASLDWETPASEALLSRRPEAYIRMAYNAMCASHNLVDITKVQGDELYMEDREKYDVVLTYSFPCQDISVGGKGAGCDEGSGTRSSLLWEVKRILSEMNEVGQLPTVLMLENVPMLLSEKNKANFDRWLEFLSSLGYRSNYALQSATDFDVPQSRKRCFMFSVLGDGEYDFPNPIPLKHHLFDLLEPQVPDHYYLSKSMMRYVLTKPTKNYVCKGTINSPVARTINTKYGNYRAGIDTYVDPKIMAIGQMYPATGNPQAGRIYDPAGLCPALDTMSGGNRQPKVIVPMRDASPIEGVSAPSVGIAPDGSVDVSMVYVVEGDDPQFVVWTGEKWVELGLRRLTPKECFRLQGVSDSDFGKIAPLFKDSTLYHMAGDSICVANLYYDFKQFCS